MEKPIKIQKLLETDNIAELLHDDDLRDIGLSVVDGYTQDENSRKEWRKMAQEAMDIAMQVAQEKTFPWPGAANVRWPGLTIAALQFNARAYPALVPGTDVVKCRVIGPDPQGEEYQRAIRIARHMSYQVLEKDSNWESDMDRLLIMAPIVGTLFKKTYFEPTKQSCVSELVTPFELVVPYFAKSLEDAARITHCIDLLPNAVEERMRKGIFLEVNLGPVDMQVTAEEMEQKGNRGLSPPTEDDSAPRRILEQHRWLDLDDDGYEEPYIVTVDKSTQKVLRLIKRYARESIETDRDEEIKLVAQSAMQSVQNPNNQGIEEQIMEQAEQEVDALFKKAEILAIKPVHYFTKFGFIPAPDGSFYDVGFGTIQRPIVESINTMLNQLIDSGTLQNSASGFVSRSSRMKKGDMKFKPFEWKQIDVVGGNLRDSIVPLPVKAPSNVLFSALQLLINYSERMFSVSEMMTGQTPGQNTPATTSMAALEQGMKVYSGIFKRMYRSLKDEFKKIYELNKLYLNPVEYFVVVGTGEQAEVYAQDYQKATSIVPAADPSVSSEQQRQMQAEFLANRAYTVPGYNTAQAERNLLEAYHIPGIDTLYPLDEQGQPAIQPPPNPEIELKKQELAQRQEDQQGKLQIAFSKLEIEAAKLGAEIKKMEADIELAIAKAEAEVAGIAIEEARLRLEAMKAHYEMLNSIVESARVAQEREDEPADEGRS